MIKLFIHLFLLIISFHLLSQENGVPSKTLIESRIQNGVKFKRVSPFKRDITSSDQADFFSLANNSLEVLKKGEKDVLFQVPSEILHQEEMILTRVNPLSEGFFFQTSDGQKSIPEKVFFYKGVLKGKENSKVTVTVHGDFIRAHIISGEDSYILGQFQQRKDKYVLMDEKYFAVEREVVCGWTEDLKGNNSSPVSNDNTRTAYSTSSKPVKIFFETDFNLYQKLGSSTLNTQNYVLSMFNEVASVYAEIGVLLNLTSSFIWTTTDPYASQSSTSDMLYAFRSTRTDFEGDLAHLLSGRSMGGVAWLGALCGSYNYGVSASQGGNPSTLPRNSFTLIVVAHELGHNLGSPHTHNCSWNGNNTRIDNCAGHYDMQYQEGSCTNPFNPFLPVRGTIMSYCHLVGGVGSYFEFHPQVATRISNYVNSVGCLDCNSAPTGSLCSNAIGISASGTYTASGPGCGNGCFTCDGAKHATWYKFLAPSNGKISISSCNKGVDTRIWVYSGVCGNFTRVGQNDDACVMEGSGSLAYASLVENITVTGNQWYYWEWDNKWSSSGFDFEFTFIPDVSACTFQNPSYTASNLNSGFYGTHQNIISSSVVQSGSNVQMTATQTITLKPGFQVQSGATFSAKIENCAPTAMIIPPQGEAPILEDFTVYPNPFQEGFTVKFSLADKERGDLIVTNLQGQQMLTRRIVNNWGQNTYEEVLSFDYLVPGIYILSLRTDQRNIYKKIIKAE